MSDSHKTVYQKTIEGALEVMRAHIGGLEPGAKVRPKELQLVLAPKGIALSATATTEVLSILAQEELLVKQSPRMYVTPGGPQDAASLQERVELLALRVSDLESQVQRLSETLGIESIR